MPLHQHVDDSEAVAALLVEGWLSPQLVARIAADLPHGTADVNVLLRWLAAVHDVGKLSPAFAIQVPALASLMTGVGLGMHPSVGADPARTTIRHERVGHLALRQWLSEVGFVEVVAEQWASVVGGHHGAAPRDDQLVGVRRNASLAGKGAWVEARRALLERAAERVGDIGALRDVRLSKPVLVLLSAAVILADWIASNSSLFPLRPIGSAKSSELTGPDDALTARRAREGWQRLRLPAQWRALPMGQDVDEVFRDRFERAKDSARPVQVAAVEAARAQSCPGLVVIEAPMGSGKTEAALLCAEVMAHASGANGVFVALPTQATTDAMFGRVLKWLHRLPGIPDGEAVTVNLAHGKAVLNDDFRAVLEGGEFARIGGGEDTDQALIAHEWLRGRKKSGLASFVVGTIDQVLFAGLKSRHLMLRHLALAGKVVVIDEVHAYDVYMSQYLNRVLEWLGAYRVPVVLLSATLPARRRAELLRAYETGRGGTISEVLPEEVGYPAVLASGGVAPVAVTPPEPSSVHLERQPDDLDELVSLLKERLEDGGCAAVVRNTVTRVQETADRLVKEFGEDEVTVTHARFLSCERAAKDRELLRRFGPPGKDTERPKRHIVVGSQVLEQSLDLDFDLMVTDLAPVDLLLQRIGRLHRHDRSRPAGLEQATCVIVGVEDWSGAPVRAVKNSRRIYGDHLLLRSAALARERDLVSLPGDIPQLVQAAYGDRPVGPDTWQPAMAEAAAKAAREAEQRAAAARGFLLGPPHGGRDSLVGWDEAGVGEVSEDHPRTVAQVRDGAESLEVLVVQRDADGGLLTPTWLDEVGGQQVPLDLEVPEELARTVAACSLRLPLSMSHPGVLDDVIAALEKNHYTSFDQSPLLRGQLVLVLDEDRRTHLTCGKANFQLTYDQRRGLLCERG